MEKTYTYYQPEYVSKFQCDGKACGAYCCRKNWRIDIDKKIYKKYSHLKPKSAAREILRNLSKSNDKDEYQIKLDENKKCPFLMENNLCSLQKNYGEEFLSETCATFPRYTWNFGEICERSLMLTCPVAAKMILLAEEPMEFEKIQVPEKIHSNFGKFKIIENLLSQELAEIFFAIQEASIGLLQERALTIEQRLLLFGLYCDKLDELLEKVELFNVEKVNSIYKDINFLQEQSAQMSAILKFNAPNYIKMMRDLFKIFCDSKDKEFPEEKNFADAAINLLQLQNAEDDEDTINAAAEKYISLSAEREKFSQRCSTVFENYLVHELFFNVYPFKFYEKPTFNYSVFLTIFKMLELITFLNSLENNEQDLTAEIIWYASNVDHNQEFMNKIADYFLTKNDIAEILQSMLKI